MIALGAGAVALVAALVPLTWTLVGSTPEVRPSPVAGATTRYLTLGVRVLPDAARGPGRGILEITVTPKAGLFLSSAHGESHGHKHRVAEFGIDLLPSGPVALDRTEVDPPEIRAPYAARVGFVIAPGAKNGTYPVRVTHRYQAMESATSVFEPDKVEVVAEILYE